MPDLVSPFALGLYAGLAAGALGTIALIEAAGPRAGSVPGIPSVPWMRRAAAEMLTRHAPAARRVVELGSGFGGLAFALARAAPDAHITGMERAAVPHWAARARLAASRRANLAFVHADVLEADLAPYDAAVCYLLPGLLARVVPRLAPGTVLISIAFPVEGRAPLEVYPARKIPIYAYRL